MAWTPACAGVAKAHMTKETPSFPAEAGTQSAAKARVRAPAGRRNPLGQTPVVPAEAGTQRATETRTPPAPRVTNPPGSPLRPKQDTISPNLPARILRRVATEEVV